ncbi:TetR/AcrR family transcriptional regulator [Frigoribacterium sp. 2-23]|uniref:TetR/AcrR family transcriptional regulator n=1 Tax=Frigoribacterium sp. 2-23 TaxID=3415006 RepID=UPI003C6EEF51
MTPASSTTRPLRADARKNRDAILSAAREAFEDEGVLVSLDGIALRAGVGNATLYRNFATREDLLAAVIESSIEAALVEADVLASSLTPQEALAEWLVSLAWQLRRWHDLPTCVASALTESASPMASACSPLQDRTAELLARAQASGDASDAVTGDDLYTLVTALSWGIDRFGDDEAAARRRVALATAGVFREPARAS